MYQALYRKYRPQTFDDVVGQQGVTETLKNQLMAGKLSHAYLFTGTRGTGKTSCAKILAKAVNCQDPQNGNPCNHCDACRAIDAGACVDVLEIDAASNNGVDHVRALRDEAVYTPSQVQKRVYIVDEVHMLSISAFNALLKIIEEPPEHLLFILATTELHKVPATILSRCQRFSFRRLQASDIAARLNYVAYQEGLELQPEAAELLATLADGALRDGLSLLDQCASASTGAVTAEGVCATLGLAGSRKTAALLQAVAEQDVNGALTLFSELYAAGKDLSALMNELGTLARDLLILKTVPKTGTGMLSGASTAAERKPLLEKLSPAELLRIVSVLQRTASGFAASADRRLDMELCLLELCSPALTLDLQSVSARLGRVETQLASGVIPAAPTPKKEAPAEAPAPQPIQPKPVPKSALPTDFWPEYLARVSPLLDDRLRGFFSVNGPFVPRLADGTLFLEAEQDFVVKIIGDDPTLLENLSREAGALLGGTVQVRLGVRKQNAFAGKDPMDELLQFGQEHGDIVKIDR